MNDKRLENITKAIKSSPEISENLRLRSELLINICGQIEKWGVTQEAAAKCLGINQPRLSDLLNGRIDKFSLESLVRFALSAELKVDLNIKDVSDIAAPSREVKVQENA